MAGLIVWRGRLGRSEIGQPARSGLTGTVGAVLLLAFVVPLPTGAAAPPASAPPSGPTAADRLYLGRLGEALVLSRAAAGRIWPGWGLEKTPLLIFEAGRIAYLVNHPAPPPDFTRLPEKLPLLGSVWVKTGRDPRFNANTSVDLAGIPTACVGYSSAPGEVENPSLRFIALTFHEAFHAYQAKAGKPGKGAVEGILLRYPELNAENLALAQLEQMILYELVRFDDTPDPDKVRSLLAIRAARLKAIGPDFLRGERGMEYQEGIPTYVEVRLVEEAKKAAAGVPGFGSDDPYSLGFSQAPELRSADYVSRLLRFSSDAGTVRMRSYGTGMALALLLDRMGVDWKTAALTGEKYLDEILAEHLPTAPDTVASLLGRAKKDHDYPDLLKLVQEKLARISQDRKQAAETFLRQEGIQVVLKLPPGPVELRSFDPLNIQVIDASTAIHRRTLSLASGESSFYASGVPVLVSLGEGPFDIRGVTVFVPADEVRLEIDRLPLSLEPGPRSFDRSLRLSGGGVTLQGSAGDLLVSPDKLKIEITLRR